MRAKSLFALFYLASLSTSALAGTSFSGEIRLDGVLQPKIKTSANTASSVQETFQDTLTLSRVRLDYQGSLSKTYEGFVRIEVPENENVQIYSFDVLPAVNNFELAIVQGYGSVNVQGAKFNLGLIQCPDVSTERLDYQMGIGPRIGDVIGLMGNHIGLSFQGQGGQLGYNIGIWEQTLSRNITSITPVSEVVTPSQLQGAVNPATNLNASEIAQSLPAASFDAKNFRYGYSARAVYVPYYKNDQAMGLGIGYSYAPLNNPVVLGVLYHAYQAGVPASSTPTVTPAIPAQGDYRLIAFTMLKNLKLDLTTTNGPLQINVGFSSQTLKAAQTATVLTTDTTGGTPVATSSDAYIFEDPGRVRSYYAEAAFLLMGNGYKFDRKNSMISGVRLAKGRQGLEVGVRYAVEDYSNILALTTVIGVDDFISSTYANPANSGTGRFNTDAVLNSTQDQNYLVMTIDNTGAVPYVVPKAVTGYSLFGLGTAQTMMNSYKSNQSGFVVDINYYFNENTALKVEFEQVTSKKQIFGEDGSYVSSIHYKTASYFRFRFDLQF